MPGKYKQTMYACYLGHITQAINNNLAPLFLSSSMNSLGCPLRCWAG